MPFHCVNSSGEKLYSFTYDHAASELQHDVIIKPLNNEQREVALMFALKLQNKNLDTKKLSDFLKSN